MITSRDRWRVRSECESALWRVRPDLSWWLSVVIQHVPRASLGISYRPRSPRPRGLVEAGSAGPSPNATRTPSAEHDSFDTAAVTVKRSGVAMLAGRSPQESRLSVAKKQHQRPSPSAEHENTYDGDAVTVVREVLRRTLVDRRKSRGSVWRKATPATGRSRLSDDSAERRLGRRRRRQRRTLGASVRPGRPSQIRGQCRAKRPTRRHPDPQRRRESRHGCRAGRLSIARSLGGGRKRPASAKQGARRQTSRRLSWAPTIV
jgi:hypothetical protein